jgi:hypothetical protein
MIVVKIYQTQITTIFWLNLIMMLMIFLYLCEECGKKLSGSDIGIEYEIS